VRAFEFRQLVALVLKVLDVPAQARQPRPKTLHERLEKPQEASDILGIPGWILHTYTAQARDLSGALDQAQQAAEEAELPHFGTVWKRQRRAAQESYVVLTLGQFAILVAEAQKNSDEHSKQE
jgi:hypothetical protein